MDKKKRKNYNKNYYEKNKEIILQKACSKIECEVCGRKIVKYNYKKHLTLPICINTLKTKKYIEQKKLM